MYKNKNMKLANAIRIDPPQGLDAEFSGIAIKNHEQLDELEKFTHKLGIVLSTSSSDLEQLLKERKEQVKELEILLPKLDAILKKHNIKGEDCEIFFQID